MDFVIFWSNYPENGWTDLEDMHLVGQLDVDPLDFTVNDRHAEEAGHRGDDADADRQAGRKFYVHLLFKKLSITITA